MVATAELAPIASVGGLGSAVAGLVRELRGTGHEVDVVLPDYTAEPLAGETRDALTTPDWTGPMQARTGTHARAGRVTLVHGAGLARSHPYLDADGNGWPDNEHRFFAFSAAVRALAAERAPDVLHLNDWHTATALAGDLAAPTVLSIHNLAYQGWADRSWLSRIGPHAHDFERDGGCNALAGGLRRTDATAVVSPRYREEILRPEHGCGLSDVLAARAGALDGILNGVESDVWDPEHDGALVAPFDANHLDEKASTLRSVRAELGLRDDDAGTRRALTVVVSRLAHQKGIDLVVPLIPYLDGLHAQLAVLGNGDADTVGRLRAAAKDRPADVAFVEGFDEALGHRLIGGGDLLLMPSRFEPCGLTQMQAMRYGTLPVVTGVGGLLDTVVDADTDPRRGTGFVAPVADPVALLDAWHRAVRAWSNASRRRAIQKRAMRADWSWVEPARRYVELYERVRDARINSRS
ncbi:MAG TPA: glycogen/starch synthase [Acidimicrobiia bacterium]|jgi:starch synthase